MVSWVRVVVRLWFLLRLLCYCVNRLVEVFVVCVSVVFCSVLRLLK